MVVGDRTSVIARLTKFRQQIGEIMELIAGRHTLNRIERNLLREKYSTLKADLNAAVKAGSTVYGWDELTELERAFCHPATSEALIHLRARTNTHPITSNWYSDLYEARIDIDFYLDQLTEDNQPATV